MTKQLNYFFALRVQKVLELIFASELFWRLNATQHNILRIDDRLSLTQPHSGVQWWTVHDSTGSWTIYDVTKRGQGVRKDGQLVIARTGGVVPFFPRLRFSFSLFLFSPSAPPLSLSLPPLSLSLSLSLSLYLSLSLSLCE